MTQIKVGNLVQDKISNFQGHSIARCTYLNGCIQHEVQAEVDENNKMQPNLWIDEEQLIDVTEMVKSRTKAVSRKGGGGHRGHP